ncbi:ear-binding coat-associated protein 2 [Seminavis robusta]|uniref:Ear-binding coat-associated protein 2 n=1 Tax=Seminavis robusta TaxID=568900 RepID=A0A9N8EH88_9STRA|nr:ear-binding coat-associated protein 2 [Seminavis robusta]|eukprot:Sro1095_g240680.1 ear-binding coat-associated protein 2 (173) ;mRNA; r:21035-21641
MAEHDLGLLDDDTYKVKILSQKILGIAEVYLYKIPREKDPGQQYFADEWVLKRPLKECSLRVERRGDALLLLFTYVQEGKQGSTLFALCCIDLINGNQDMNHHVLTVGDSSRYFVVRVSDEQGEREALLGLGFRERDEAADFRAAISHYVNAVIKEKMARSAAAGEEELVEQ